MCFWTFFSITHGIVFLGPLVKVISKQPLLLWISINLNHPSAVSKLSHFKKKWRTRTFWSFKISNRQGLQVVIVKFLDPERKKIQLSWRFFHSTPFHAWLSYPFTFVSSQLPTFWGANFQQKNKKRIRQSTQHAFPVGNILSTGQGVPVFFLGNFEEDTVFFLSGVANTAAASFHWILCGDRSRELSHIFAPWA